MKHLRNSVAKADAKTTRDLRIVMGGAARHRAADDERNCWITPRWLIDDISAVPGFIQLDPCTVASNPCGARRFFTVEDDGLKKSWRFARTVFINPPYSNVEPWVDKAIDAATNGVRIYMLLPVRTDAAYHHRLVAAATDILLFRKRIRFLRSDGSEAGSPAFASMLVGIGTSVRPLSTHGTVVVPTGW